MKRSWIIGIAVLAALGLLVAWIARNTYWDEVTVPRFLTGEAARNPFYGIQRLAEELGATTEWRRSLGGPPSPSSIVMLKNWNWNLIESRRTELEGWVESGGRLVLDDSLAGGKEVLETWSGLKVAYESDGAESDSGEETEVEDENQDEEPSEAFGFLAPCRELELTIGRAQSDPERTTYELCGLTWRGAIASSRTPEWALEDEEGTKAVRIGIGRGKVILVHGQPFTTRRTLEADNAALFVDAVLLRRGDHVVFVSDGDHASLLELIWLYGAPAVVLALVFIALALWRNAARFGPLEAQAESSRRSLAEQIRGTGRFVFATDGGRSLHAAMARALHEAARQRIPGYEGLHSDERIEALAKLAGVDAERLAETINYSGKRSHHEFKNAIALLDTARAKVIAHDASLLRKRPSRAAELDSS